MADDALPSNGKPHAVSDLETEVLRLGAPPHQIPGDQGEHDHDDDHVDDDLFGTERVEGEHRISP